MDTLDESQEPLPNSKEERTWALAAHLSAFSGHFIPFGHVLGPLLIWILKRDEYPLVNDQAKEALNAQISYTLYLLVSFVLCFVIIGFPLLFLAWGADIVFTIMGAVAAYEGKRYRYPFILRFVQ